jgi:hypothetical protein
VLSVSDVGCEPSTGGAQEGNLSTHAPIHLSLRQTLSSLVLRRAPQFMIKLHGKGTQVLGGFREGVRQQRSCVYQRVSSLLGRVMRATWRPRPRLRALLLLLLPVASPTPSPPPPAVSPLPPKLPFLGLTPQLRRHEPFSPSLNSHPWTRCCRVCTW